MFGMTENTPSFGAGMFINLEMELRRNSYESLFPPDLGISYAVVDLNFDFE